MAEVPERFVELISTVTRHLKGRALEPGLSDVLDAEFPAGGPVFSELEALCRQGCAEGWLCAREQAGIRFGRPVKAGPATHGFSVDVVEMDDVVGPHHRHPNGEIDMVMPLDGAARFDGTARGWKVYEPDSAHHPTVTGGKALVLFLLPEGAIEFTRA
ncbi:MAG: DUF4863 family protein [Pseudomonadota bacterium]